MTTNQPTQFGIIGLSKMGSNLSCLLGMEGYSRVVYDHQLIRVERAVSRGAIGAASLDDFVSRIKPPRNIWLLVNPGQAEAASRLLRPLLCEGDLVVNGSDWYAIDDIYRTRALYEQSIAHFRRSRLPRLHPGRLLRQPVPRG